MSCDAVEGRGRMSCRSCVCFVTPRRKSCSDLLCCSDRDPSPGDVRRLRKGIEIDRRPAQSGASSHLLTAQAAALSTGRRRSGDAGGFDVAKVAGRCGAVLYGPGNERAPTGLSGWMMSLVQPGPRPPKLPRKCGAGKAQAARPVGTAGGAPVRWPPFTVSGLGSRLGAPLRYDGARTGCGGS